MFQAATTRDTGELKSNRRVGAHWVGLHDDRVAGRDRSLARLMRRMSREGIPPLRCAYLMVPVPLPSAVH